jgi:hypothetical protein
MEQSKVSPGMQVLTSDGEYIGNVGSHREDGFTLRRLTGAEGEQEQVPTLWIHKVDQHVHLNRTGAEAIAGWKSLSFKTSSGSAPIGLTSAEKRPSANAANVKWLLWIGLAVVAILISLVLFRN